MGLTIQTCEPAASQCDNAMTSVEESIRSAIARSSDQSVEARNKVYLRAREAIEKLPAAQAQPAMQELFETVKTIETEYARLDLARASKSGSAPSAPVFQQPAGNKNKRRSTKSFRFPSVQLPWKLLVVVFVLLVIMAVSARLLWTQFEDAGLIKSHAPVPTTPSNLSDPATAKITNLLTFTGHQDVAKLTTRPDGSGQLDVPEDARSPSAGVLLPHSVEVYNRDAVQITPGRYYLLRFRLRVQPADARIELSAGFAAPEQGNDNGSTSGQNIFRSFIGHQGEVTNPNARESGNVLVFSRLFEWSDIAKDIPIEKIDGLVRPVIVVTSLTEGAKIWFKSLSVDAI